MLRLLRLFLPALLPSWRFFDTVAPSPRIEVAVIGTGGGLDWREFRPRPTHVSKARMARRMIWNPRWNESLYLASLAERVIADGRSHAIREISARIAHSLPGEGQVRYRLIFVTHDKGGLERHELFRSEPFEIGRGP